jgi:membrane-bound lytic murein transglycosylase B
MGQMVAWLSGVGLSVALSATVQADYSAHQEALTLIDEMVSEHDFDREALQQLFAQVEKKQSILDAISRPAEKTKTWAEYRDIFVQSSRINKGVAFWQENREALNRVEKELGVPAEIVVAIIGVETRYGRIMGSYRVVDALSTLGFDYPKRSKFFRKELKNFLLLAREQQRDPLTLKGSYAGAMGYGQFMPSSYRHYAKDYDGDGFIDIWANKTDAIGSVANYFVRHGWQPGQPVVSRARTNGEYDRSVINDSLKPRHTVASLAAKGYLPLDEYEGDKSASLIKLQGKNGAEFWMGLNNFYTITRYNHSRLYAMAVYQLSQEIAAAMPEAG